MVLPLCAGSSAAALLCKVFDMVEGAWANNDNLEALGRSATLLLDVILEKQEQLQRGGAFKRVVDAFEDLLKASRAVLEHSRLPACHLVHSSA